MIWDDLQSEPCLHVRDLEPENTLVMNSQEIREILRSIGYPGCLYDYGTLLVKLGEGEYASVYGIEWAIPYLNSRVYKLYENGVPSIELEVNRFQHFRSLL